jgi:hypothetical protein
LSWGQQMEDATDRLLVALLITSRSVCGPRQGTECAPLVARDAPVPDYSNLHSLSTQLSAQVISVVQDATNNTYVVPLCLDSTEHYFLVDDQLHYDPQTPTSVCPVSSTWHLSALGALLT